MGNRYWITGVQLGMIMALLKREPQEAFKILEEIHNKQYLCEAKELKKLKYKEAKKILKELNNNLER